MTKVLSRLSAKRKKYYSMVQTYKMRREAWRKKFNIVKINNRHEKLPEKYLVKSKMFSLKIGRWNRQIKRIDELGQKISQLERAVYNFTGERIAGYPTLKVPESIKLAKSLYYKFGLENRIRPIELRDYIGLTGMKQKDEPYIYRKRFTRSFKDTPKNKEKWVQFKEFYNSADFNKKHRYGTILKPTG